MVIIQRADRAHPLRFACVDARVGCLIYKLCLAGDEDDAPLEKRDADALVRPTIAAEDQTPWQTILRYEDRAHLWGPSVYACAISALGKK